MYRNDNENVNIGNYKHNFHLIDRNPWPMISSFALIGITIGFVESFLLLPSFTLILSSFLLLLGTATIWWRDIIREALFLGDHTRDVVNGLFEGIILFIISECLLFVGLFWAYIHLAIEPSVMIGNDWPPMGIEHINPLELPLLNTLLLLSAAAAITWSHHTMVRNNVNLGSNNNLIITPFADNSEKDNLIRNDKIMYIVSLIGKKLIKNSASKKDKKYFKLMQSRIARNLNIEGYNIKHKRTLSLSNYNDINLSTQKERLFSIILGVVLSFIFIYFQYIEYKTASFDISDSSFASAFFMATTFHGLHVMIGGLFLLISAFRISSYSQFKNHHTNLLCSLWYFHFTDVVWLILYVLFYLWTFN